LAPQKEFKPIHEVIAYVAERIGEPKDTKTLLPRTRTAIRQAASDGRVRFRGRKQVGQIASNAKLTFDTILTDIPKDYGNALQRDNRVVMRRDFHKFLTQQELLDQLRSLGR